MPSIIPGYEYDVFISYRHKDNKGEHWVTDFIAALKNELESTFKEDVSIYFDENPHDGLLENHDVDRSLEGKLKCLIFIPILSQTYCDPKSFAWQYEFCVFNRLVKSDKFGRDVKLRNGNVASRILPVKIHDVDDEDRSLLQAELGGVLRGVEFIYKTPGVNRPLSPDDDRKENLNHTNYRDQVNKVANATKEIITAMRNPGLSDPVRFEQKKIYDVQRWYSKRKVLAFVSSATLALAIVVFFLTQFNKGHGDKSIAVIPFVDLSESRDQGYFCDGMTEEILNHLAKVGGMRVISRTSCMRFKGSTSSLKEIASELGVTNILEGSIRKSGDKVRVSVQLIDVSSDEHLWSETYDFIDLKDIFSLQTEVSTNVAQVLKGKLTESEKITLAKTNTVNPDAYELYLRGRFFWAMRTVQSYDSAESYYKRAILLDPDYALAYAGLADCYTLGLQGMTSLDEAQVAKVYLAKAISLDSNLCEALTTKGFIQSHIEYDWKNGKKTLEKAIQINPNYPIARLYHGNIQIFTNSAVDKGIEEVKVAVRLDPLSASLNWALGNRYAMLDRNEEAVLQFRKTIALDSNNLAASLWLGYSLVQHRRFNEAIEGLERIKEKFGAGPDLLIAQAHSEQGKKEVAKAELEELLKVETIKSNETVLLAHLYMSLKNYEGAVAQLEQAYETRALTVLTLKNNPIYDPIRNLPSFKVLLKKMNYD